MMNDDSSDEIRAMILMMARYGDNKAEGKVDTSTYRPQLMCETQAVATRLRLRRPRRAS